MKKKIWHRNYPDFVPENIDIEKITMSEIFHRTAQKYPAKNALIFLNEGITYKELDENSNRFSDILKSFSINKGDKVALLLPNCPQLIFAYHGIWRIGAVAVACNPTLSDHELKYQLNTSDSDYLVTIDMLADRMMHLYHETRIKGVISTGLTDFMNPITSKPSNDNNHYKTKGLYQLLNLMEKANPEYNPDYAAWNEPSMIIFTGGTTGIPKGAVLTVGNNSSAAQITAAWYGNLDENEILLGIFPFFHIGGFNGGFSPAWSKGWTMVLMPKPDVREMFNMIIKHKITLVAAVPTLFTQLLQLPAWKTADKSFIKYFLSGAAPVPAAISKQLYEDTGCGMIEQAGMTETNGINNIVPLTGPYKIGSCGVPPSNIETKIVDLETGRNEMPPGENGEIIHRGPNIMHGYYNNPEETALVLREGWLYTGDIGHMDKDGFVYIVDRKKDVILSGGNNFYPRDIDEVLQKHPKIKQVCTIGVPDDKMGERVKSLVVLHENESVTIEELNEHCLQYLGRYKIPREYEFVDKLPTSAAGKVLRYVLREQENEKDKK